MDAVPSRSGTATDAAICAAIGVVALAAGLVADAAGGTPGVAAGATGAVALAGLLADRLDRGGPATDVFDLELRVGYRRQMALRTFPVLSCCVWVVLATALLDASAIAQDEVTEVLGLASAVVAWSVTERILIRRIAPRADADDGALHAQIQERLDSGVPAPTSFGWRRGRIVLITGGFSLLGLVWLALALLGTGGGRIFGALMVALFGYVAVQTARPLVLPVAVTVDVRGLTLPFQGTLPWAELTAVGLRRESFALYLDLLVEDGPHEWATRRAQRRLRKRRGTTELALLTVDAEPADLLAAIRTYRPELLVLLPGPDGAPVAL